MYTDSQIQSACGPDNLKYVKNKNRGGRSNTNGATYETIYAAYKIAILAAAELMAGGDGTYIDLQDQVLCFVDDLVIDGSQRARHSQLKNATSLSWISGPHALEEDFRLQRLLDRCVSRTATYELVVSDRSLQSSMIANRPNNIREVRVRHFAAANNFLDLITAHPALKAALTTLCAGEPKIHTLEFIFATIVGAWTMSGSKTSLGALINHIAAQPHSPLAPLLLPYSLPASARRYFESLPEISAFGISKNRFFYEASVGHGKMLQWYPYHCGMDAFHEFVRSIEEHPPTTLMDLLARTGS